MTNENWQYILVNGNNDVSVLTPKFQKGALFSIKGLRPFDKKDDSGTPLIPKVEDANELKRNIYKDFFKKPFKNLLILSGAGSSIDAGGFSMGELWSKAEKKYKVQNGKKDEIDGFKIIREKVNFTSDKKDLEALLSQIDGFCKFAENKEIQIGDDKKTLSEIKKEIFDLIKEKCTIPKPTKSFPHKFFLDKLLQRKQTSPRVKIFTLNYDLLFEYAATEVNAVIIDGFSFTTPRTFSGRFFDYDIVQREGSKLKEEDNFIQRVFHLHKLHGSLNWEKEKISDRILIKDNPDKPLMVYPREAKYEDSYEQPFFEMMARFQRSLRLNNDTMLLCIGYSFNDKHINAAIEEALNQNPSFRLAVVVPDFNNDTVSNSLKEIKKLALESERILIVSETFEDFAKYYPEIRTYETDNYVTINLKHEQAKD